MYYKLQWLLLEPQAHFEHGINNIQYIASLKFITFLKNRLKLSIIPTIFMFLIILFTVQESMYVCIQQKKIHKLFS